MPAPRPPPRAPGSVHRRRRRGTSRPRSASAAAASAIVSVRWPKPRLPRWSTMNRPARSGSSYAAQRSGRAPPGNSASAPRWGSPIRRVSDRPRPSRSDPSIAGSTATTWSTRRSSHRSAARSIRESRPPGGSCRRSRRRRDRRRATTGRPSSADGGAGARRRGHDIRRSRERDHDVLSREHQEPRDGADEERDVIAEPPGRVRLAEAWCPQADHPTAGAERPSGVASRSFPPR